MTFHSILFERTSDQKKETHKAPDFFIDLNLDQVVDAITANKQEYNLKPFFFTLLNDIDEIKYRHEIMQDLENKILFEHIKSFAQKMRTMREHLTQAQKLYYKYQKRKWFLDAVEIYCDAVNYLLDALTPLDLKSRGFLAFHEYVTNYVKSVSFTSLLSETKKIEADLSALKYCLLIKDNSIKVCKYESEIDYSIEVEKTFEKFKQGAVKDYRVKFSTWADMNHVEAEILGFVAQLYPSVFTSLDQFYVKNSNYLDEIIGIFDREIQFYIAYLEYAAIFTRTGLKFCYPQISDHCKEIYNYEGFDLALASKLTTENRSIVCNDFYFKGRERIFIVSGPNQGGKTTFTLYCSILAL